MAYYVKANKTKMVELLRLYGYKPIVHSARFEKMFRRRSYTLIWKEPAGFFEASLFTAGGVSHLSVTHDGENKMLRVPLAVLKRLNMVEPVSASCNQ